MLVLKIVGAVIGALLFLLLLVVLSSVHVVFWAGSEREFSVGVRFWGMLFGKETESKNPVLRFLKWLTSREEKPQEPQSEEKPKADTASLVKQNVGMLFPILERVFGVLKRCRISRCNVCYVSGGENAAMDYGEACAVIYPLVGYWQNRRWLRKRNTQVDLGWDYENESGNFDLEIAVRVRIAVVLWAALMLLVQYKKQKGAVA